MLTQCFTYVRISHAGTDPSNSVKLGATGGVRVGMARVGIGVSPTASRTL